ncbi:hypothetical protein FRB93_013849 [Tulasnella sp. JGI-2019a]|nr:hypothetical protein FRB93_013849 [Tulasnella sp. JGI-2019a]
MSGSAREGMDDAMELDVDLQQGQAGPSSSGQRNVINDHPPAMDIDDVNRPAAGVSETAVVVSRDQTGQSASKGGSPSLPFHPMRIRPGPPDLRLRLHAGQDLLGRLGLLSAFDELVRPYIRVPEDDKGKGKQVEVDGQMVELGLAIQEPEEHWEHGKGWREFAAAVPGKFSTKKDTYLSDLMSPEPRPRFELRPLDRSTLTGFILQEGQLDVETLNELGIGPDSERKKKHKDKKKAHFANGTAISTTNGLPGASTSNGATPAAGPSNLTNGNSRPQPPRPKPPQEQSRTPGLGTPLQSSGQQAGPSQVPNGTTGAGVKSLKVRKERDEGGSGNAQEAASGNANGTAQQPPRPHKKRKTDGTQLPNNPSMQPHHSHSHPPPQPMQQATPTF